MKLALNGIGFSLGCAVELDELFNQFNINRGKSVTLIQWFSPLGHE